jgi:hypothetical protein
MITTVGSTLAVVQIDFNVAQAIQALATLVGALFAGLAYLKANKASRTSARNGVAIEEVKHLTNSLTSKAIADAHEAGVGAGNLTGRREQTEERLTEANEEARRVVDETRRSQR